MERARNKGKNSFGRSRRLKGRKAIQAVFLRGRRASDGLVTLFVLSNSDRPDDVRMGVAVSARHGKAVRRNRIKRLCREALRLMRPELPAGWDYVLVPRPGVVLSVPKLKNSLRALARRATAGDPGDRPQGRARPAGKRGHGEKRR